MRRTALLLSVVLLCSSAFAEDPQLRGRAMELIERSLHASQVQTTPQLQYVPNETVLTFRATGPDGVVREGSYTRVFAGPKGTRQEFTMGDFHMVRFDFPDRVAFVGPSHVLPPEGRAVLRLIPISNWRLDNEDIVHEIRQENRKGVAAQCILFTTIRGAQQENNEICVDAHTGAQIYDRSGAMEVESSQFFQFMGSYQPGHISQYRNGALVMDIDLTRKRIEGPISADMFTPPPDAAIGMRCHTFTRAYGNSMPQPAGNGGPLADVIVHVVIGNDGRVHNPVVEGTENPDLNADAIKQVLSWTFTPAQCNGNPNEQEANLVVHFSR